MTRGNFLAFFLYLAFCLQSFAGSTGIFYYAENANKNNIAVLDVDWEFYWKKLYSFSDFNSNNTGEPDLMVRPSSWNNLVVDREKCGSYGFATYRLTLKGLPGKDLILTAYSVQTACRIFINDSLAGEVGKVGESADESVPANRDLLIVIPAKYREAELIVQISNFHHRKGGFSIPFEIGDPDTMISQHQLFYILDAIEGSALAIIGLFFMALYIFRRKDKSVLYFSLFCITLGFRPVIAVNYMLGDLLPWLNWTLMIKLEYMGAVAPGLFMLLFLKKLFPEQLPTLVVKILGTIFMIILFIIFLTPVSVFSWMTFAIITLIPLGIVVLTITIIRAVMAKVDGSKFAGLGVIVLFMSLILKILTYTGMIPTIHVLITVLDIIFIFSMSMILGSRFSLQFVKVETLQEETEIQKQEIEVKNKEILDSINYAKRLQSAILPPEKHIRSHFSESFILYQPKDIVAGDFYWMREVKKENARYVLLAVCDCTGHGVPGAMVSVVCNNALNRAVREFELTDPGRILDKTRELVIAEFEKSDEEVKDGMDISLISLEIPDNEMMKLKWAGANNPLWYIENSEMKEIKADKQPIGLSDKPNPFQTHSVSVSKGTWIYLITDGYADQFGGAIKGSVGGKKLKGSNLKKFLVEFHPLPAEEQKKKLIHAFKEWKGDLEQLDDVCIIGVRL